MKSNEPSGESCITPPAARAEAPRDLSPIERAVLRAYEAGYEPIGVSDLDGERPVRLYVRTTLGELRKLHMQGMAVTVANMPSLPE